VTHVRTRPWDSKTSASLRRRGAAVSLGLLAAGALTMSTGVAGAAPQPTVAQVQQRLTQLNNQAQRLDEQYDQVLQELASASQQLSLVNTEAARYLARFNSLRDQVAQIAAAAYEEGSLNSPQALITSSNPQQILNQSSILLELSASNSNQMTEFVSAARQLTGAQQSARRVRDGILTLRSKLAAQKASLNKLITQQKALLAQLTPAQQAATGPGTGTGSGGGTGTIGGHDPLPTSTQAEKAVEFAFDQIGCPYVFGGTGPCPDGYDCSGLVMQAWASAGVSIPRTSYEQMSELPAVSTSELEPGDILGFAGNSHVGIYVGNNELINAPQTGELVQEDSLTGWFAENLDGAVRP
jgi:peptidoglycan DL-endopeptidase CwlO